jgi:biotin carboxyl carrier protein
MIHITANNQFTFELNGNKNDLKITGNEASIQFEKIDANTFSILIGNKSYNAELISLDTATKTACIKVNGNKYDLVMKDQYDDLLKSLGIDAGAAKKINDIKAPMPGLVLKVLVKDGDIIKKGDNLLVLEAMKMENSIKAPADATIKAVKIIAGDKVEKNQVMILLA